MKAIGVWVALTATAAAAPPSPAARVHAEALAGGHAYAVAVSLSDEVGARAAGSAGAARAVKWAMAQLTGAGLSNVHAELVRVPHWIRGRESAELLNPAQHRLVVTALGGSVPTPPGGIVAEVLEVASLDELKALPDGAAAHKIVYLHVVMKRTAGFEGYGAAVPARSQGAVLAAKKGALAVLVRSIGTGGERLAHTGAMRYDQSVPKIPSGALAAEDGDLLHRLGSHGPCQLRLQLETKVEGEVESANVVGDYSGKDVDQVVLVGAHLDSWDLGLGAVDDAAGVGMALDTVKAMTKAGVRPRRTVRVVLFMNEEFGLTGAIAYAATHAMELGRHVAAFEADAGAGRPTGIGVVGDPAAVKWLRAQTATLGAALPAVRAVEEAGADLIPMRSAGVPGLTILQDVSHYFDWHHTIADTTDKIDPQELAAASAALAATVFLVADAPDTLPHVATPSKLR